MTTKMPANESDAWAACTSDEERFALLERTLSTPLPEEKRSTARLNYLRALNNACVLAFSLGNTARAVELADRGVPFIAENPHIAHAAACAYVAVGRLEDAMKCVVKAVEHEYRRLGALRVDDDLAPLRGRPGFPVLKPEDRARYEDLERATPETAAFALGAARNGLWGMRSRWSEEDWFRLCSAAAPFLRSGDPACAREGWELVASALHYGPDELRETASRARMFGLLANALAPMFAREPRRLLPFAQRSAVSLLTLAEIDPWLDALPHDPGADPEISAYVHCAKIIVRRRARAFDSPQVFLADLGSTHMVVRATAAEELAEACRGSFFGGAGLSLDAGTLEAVRRSEVESPGILWSFLGPFWRERNYEPIVKAAGTDIRDWVFALLAESPSSWVYEEFFDEQQDLVRLIRIGRSDEARLAAVENDLDFEAACTAASTP